MSGTFPMQPVLRKKNLEYICKLIPGDQVLTCSNLDGTRTEPRGYHISNITKGGPNNKRLLAILFRRLNDPAVVYHFERLATGDFKWLCGEEYDNDFDTDDLYTLMMEAK